MLNTGVMKSWGDGGSCGSSQHVWRRGQRATLRNWFFPSTTLVPGTELWLPGLGAGATWQAVVLASMALLSTVSWTGEKALDEESTPLDASWEAFPERVYK